MLMGHDDLDKLPRPVAPLPPAPVVDLPRAKEDSPSSGFAQPPVPWWLLTAILFATVSPIRSKPARLLVAIVIFSFLMPPPPGRHPYQN
jgi:hypothetical protein